MDSNQTAPLAAPAPQSSTVKDIMGPLAAGFYALLTLLPDSSSLIVSWPWVFVWQVALFLPWLWLLRQGWTQKQFVLLGYTLDYGIALSVLGLVGSTLVAPFPQQARWYGWAALCVIAALYALNAWCSSPERRQQLLISQGGLSLAFIVVSLSLWVSQTLLPELERLQGLRAAGLALGYDFSVLELRNWAPIGHQNYVAGYLVLSLPLLFGLSLTTQSKWQWLWRLGVVLGLVDLYTTSSRGGLLGIAVVASLGIALLLGTPRLTLRARVIVGCSLLAGLIGIVGANNRLRSFVNISAIENASGETAFRAITNVTGWAIGLDHPFLGAGPGSVPLLYQAYRPAWAGREAELVYQLHSTPAQIWAELGGCGIVLGMVMVSWLGYWGWRVWRSYHVFQKEPLLAGVSRDRTLTWSLLAGLAGYGVVSLTDYQLDIVCIIGTLLIYGVSLLSLLRQYIPSNATVKATKIPLIATLCWGIIGLLIAVGLWLTPIHRAWQLSSLGFAALSQKQIEPFKTYLEQAYRLAPWEPYYSYQLGWNLSFLNAASQSEDEQVNRTRLAQSLTFFKHNVEASPNQESGRSNLGWVQLFNRELPQATGSFLKASQLMPAKHGVYYSLGQSLLWQNKPDLGVQALALEIVRNPLFLTSPLLRTPSLNAVYPQVQAAVVQLYQQLLQNRQPQDPLTAYLHHCLGGVYWWQGRFAAAEAEWRKDGTALGQAVLAIAKNTTPPTDIPILKAWLDPQNRTQWIEKALLQANKAIPDPGLVQALRASMDQSQSLDEWLKQKAPTRQLPRERTGFGVLSRHIDGPAPLDFFPIAENIAVTQFFTELLPSPGYSPSLDLALQPLREALHQKLQQNV